MPQRARADAIPYSDYDPNANIHARRASYCHAHSDAYTHSRIGRHADAHVNTHSDAHARSPSAQRRVRTVGRANHSRRAATAATRAPPSLCAC